MSGSSPHTRGARRAPVGRGSGWRIIPAYAGSTCSVRAVTFAFPDHPRIRGEHRHRLEDLGARAGSSPHTRGALWGSWATGIGRGIIPAYAGSTSAPSPGRGSVSGSSPHTRGARDVTEIKPLGGGIIPAYAGSTDGLPLAEWRRADHPRIRGEHAGAGDGRVHDLGSSPHTRGARRCRSSPRYRWGIIPAYAGSTPWTSFAPSPYADHPRIRGEHFSITNNAGIAAGSSPHTRGAHLEIPAIPRIAAVIIPVFLYPSPTPQEEADRSMVLLTLS